MDKEAREISIQGIVQGVGFRPFLYRIAKELDLTGWVCNDGAGVLVAIEGEEQKIERFLHKIRTHAPPLSRIDALSDQPTPLQGYDSFTIRSSLSTEKSSTITPDIALCQACLEEMRNPKNRRYRYPFITCTDCGPRYTILSTLPYDRPNTSMASFPLCEDCQKEYDDPNNRRYHAQPIACWKCGPTLHLHQMSSFAKSLARKRSSTPREKSLQALAQSIELLRQGGIVAIKGLGGFHLFCDASNDTVIQRLREAKKRPKKPFAVMVKDLEMAKSLAKIHPAQERLLLSKERPIVLLEKSHLSSSILSEEIAPEIDRIGLMLPYTPLHHLIFEDLSFPLLATSANFSQEPILYEAKEVERSLGGIVDAILDHDRAILNPCDDSVAQIVGNRTQWLRLARGVAPLSLPWSRETSTPLLALGAQQKNLLALALRNQIVLTPYIGDLGSLEAMEYFKKSVATLKRFYPNDPKVLLHDKHPGYATTQWAKEQKAKDPSLRTLSLQHHYAHALAVMAEHRIHDQECLAFVWDGTGYGEDGSIWGGEVFLADTKSYERIAHLRTFKLLGGERAIREPRRVALALLFELYSLEELSRMNLPTISSFQAHEIRLLHQAWSHEINAPHSSSMGRLFDAFASLGDLCQYQSYEGEAGLLLEKKAAQEPKAQALPFEFYEGIIDWEPALRTMLQGKESFASGMIEGLAQIVEKISSSYPEMPVILTGGVFQNRTLSERLESGILRQRLILPKQVPPNDSAIALGQLWKSMMDLS